MGEICSAEVTSNRNLTHLFFLIAVALGQTVSMYSIELVDSPQQYFQIFLRTLAFAIIANTVLGMVFYKFLVKYTFSATSKTNLLGRLLLISCLVNFFAPFVAFFLDHFWESQTETFSFFFGIGGLLWGLPSAILISSIFAHLLYPPMEEETITI